MATMTVGYPGQGATVVQAIAAPSSASTAHAQMHQQAQVLAAHAHAAAAAAGPPALLAHPAHPQHEHHGLLSLPDSGQLTLTYQGKSYVFDGVRIEKLEAVLSLLNDEGRSFAGQIYGSVGSNAVGLGMQYSCKKNSDQRQISLNRFREKRKERTFDKKIRYSVRKEVAEKMNRNKGQFAKKGEGADGADSGGDTGPAICTHCGTHENDTPMMRKGPQGPRTLCNACGLMWANKGCMRDLSKSQGKGIPRPPSDGRLGLDASQHGSPPQCSVGHLREHSEQHGLQHHLHEATAEQQPGSSHEEDVFSRSASGCVPMPSAAMPSSISIMGQPMAMMVDSSGMPVIDMSHMHQLELQQPHGLTLSADVHHRGSDSP
eukprot:CAMPEP_0177617356 /NCGR_PEP_ID=MMETSP0419_2-20121207/24817_1 /TAXON_ID=582737 /ORGANISM="Tetraselmis sp., Strain GSL018" /LENGTH=373 /DNA_ID=CAMNT_0019115819 /DNA_START=292 /DNA_END=1414 /DNA_ORIENTATION=-